MHPRVSLHQVAFLDRPTGDFIAFARAQGIGHVTLVTPKLGDAAALEEAEAALAPGGVRVGTVNHLFGVFPDLARDSGEAGRRLTAAIATAARLGAGQIYLITGGRGQLDWEGAAARFAELLAEPRVLAKAQGIGLLVENASAFNVDIHLAHTLDDAVRLAQIAGIGVCIELHACWMEGDLRAKLRRAVPLAGLVQVSDYVLGDRASPCRAVPGDGAMPLESLIGDILDAGYTGLFDLELVGPRIAAEGPESACARAAERLSEMLIGLGA